MSEKAVAPSEVVARRPRPVPSPWDVVETARFHRVPRIDLVAAVHPQSSATAPSACGAGVTSPEAKRDMTFVKVLPRSSIALDASATASTHVAPVSAGACVSRWNEPSASSSLPLPLPDDDESLPPEPPSPCLSSTPPSFVAPEMLRAEPANNSITRESEQAALQSFPRASPPSPGLYALWRMRRILTVYSDSSQGVFVQRLMAKQVRSFQFVRDHIGLSTATRCFYTLGSPADVVYQETPLRAPHARFSDDGTELHLAHAADAHCWTLIDAMFDVVQTACILSATLKGAPEH